MDSKYALQRKKYLMKKIILICDLDGFVGVLNSSYPYNWNIEYVYNELEYVQKSLKLLNEFNIKTTFAITGFSAEDGLYPYTFPELIKEIACSGHEIASHSWRHEWIPLFKVSQIERSLLRSKKILEQASGLNLPVYGFVPPHNKPSTWIERAAFSFGDRGIYPFFKLGNLTQLFKILKKTNYRWVRISYKPIWKNFFNNKITEKQAVYFYNNLLILQNQYVGFDEKIINYINDTNFEYYIVSGHPAMLQYNDDRSESWKKFEYFINYFSMRKDVLFIRPMDILLNP